MKKTAPRIQHYFISNMFSSVLKGDMDSTRSITLCTLIVLCVLFTRYMFKSVILRGVKEHHVYVVKTI